MGACPRRGAVGTSARSYEGDRGPPRWCNSDDPPFPAVLLDRGACRRRGGGGARGRRPFRGPAAFRFRAARLGVEVCEIEADFMERAIERPGVNRRPL